jgi:two-component system sensor histidine kinase CiaH
MQLFESATTKLTLWYLALIMLISIGFSTVLYRISASELRRTLPPNAGILEVVNPGKYQILRQAYIDESDLRLQRNLVLINIAMLAVGGCASYLLARRTLRPIEEAMEAQGRFVSDASHELRTPLTAMHTEIEVALRDSKLDKTQMRELLKSNLEEVDKLQGLSDRLLQLTNGRDVVMSSVPLDESAIDAMNRVMKNALAKKIAIENNIGRAHVRGNQESLTDLLTILLDNAIKYSPEKSNVVMSSKTDGKYAQIQLRDNGIGIKASDLPHIFDRFYRADTSRSHQNVSGYGLGLSIAKKIVDLHNGTIDAHSTPGKGTTFTIRIPLS